MTTKNPKWWTSDHESGWERVKGAFQRDWEQTKHDAGSKSAPNLHQSAGDTIKQATAHQPANTFATHEAAFRYGHGAHAYHNGQAWDDKLESTLKADYHGDWNNDRDQVKHAYHYGRGH